MSCNRLLLAVLSVLLLGACAGCRGDCCSTGTVESCDSTCCNSACTVKDWAAQPCAESRGWRGGGCDHLTEACGGAVAAAERLKLNLCGKQTLNSSRYITPHMVEITNRLLLEGPTCVHESGVDCCVCCCGGADCTQTTGSASNCCSSWHAVTLCQHSHIQTW